MNGERSIRRILVALDASPHSLAALRAACELAAALKADLAGIFVEDINLLRLADLPFTREFGVFSARPREIDIEHIERQLRAQSGQARRAMAALAGPAQVHWTFQVARGSVAVEVLAAAAEADLITLGRLGWSPARQRPLGSTARAVLAQGPQLALIMERGVRLGLPIACIYDGSPLGRQALTVAANLARLRNYKLIVFLMTGEPETSEDLQQQAAHWLAAQGMEAQYRPADEADAIRLSRLLQRDGCGLLVLGAESAVLQSEELFGLIAQIDCPVLVVR